MLDDAVNEIMAIAIGNTFDTGHDIDPLNVICKKCGMTKMEIYTRGKWVCRGRPDLCSQHEIDTPHEVFRRNAT